MPVIKKRSHTYMGGTEYKYVPPPMYMGGLTLNEKGKFEMYEFSYPKRTCDCVKNSEGVCSRGDCDTYPDLDPDASLDANHRERDLPAEWLVEAYKSPSYREMVHIVSCSADSGTVTLAVPIFHRPTGTVASNALRPTYVTGYVNTQSPLAFVSLRCVYFQDGKRWVSKCTNPGCKSFWSQGRLCSEHFFSSVTPDFSHISCADADAEDLLCECGHAALHARHSSTEDFFEELQEIGEKEPISKRIIVDDKQYIVACAEPAAAIWGDVSNWGVLRHTEDRTRWLCTTCPVRSNCLHTRKEEDVEAHQWSDEIKEKRFQKFFDTDTGTRRLTCDSRNPIPEAIKDIMGTECYQRYQDFVQNKAGIPAVCEAQDDKHGSCGACTWIPTDAKCIVFTSSAIVETALRSFTCATCNTRRNVDGSEYCLLIKGRWNSPAFCGEDDKGGTTIAFHWELLYDAIRSMGECQKWWQIWCGRIAAYADLGNHTEAQLCALSFLYSQFQQATMDFVQLMHIDFSSALRCQCDQPWCEVVADGVTVSCRTNNLHLSAPFTPSADIKQIWKGSTFKDRVYVANAKARALLHALSSKTEACTLADWNQLHQLLEGTHEVLVELLDLACAQTEDDCTSVYVCQPWAGKLLHALSTSAPACVIIRPAQFPLVQHFIDNLDWGTKEDEQTASATLPMLFDLAREAKLQASKIPALLSCVVRVLKELLEVAKQAFKGAGYVGRAEDPQGARAANSRRRTPLPGERPPSAWNEEEAYFRQGIHGGPTAYVPNDLGGAQRPLRWYQADRAGKRAQQNEEQSCTKHVRSGTKLSPGLFVAWCSACKAPAMWSLMADAESPATVFELVYTRLPAGHRLRVIYDNACNAQNYFLNREAEFAELIEWYVDELHWHGHRRCCLAYNTGEFKRRWPDDERVNPGFRNSSLAEQRNSKLAKLKPAAVHMNQFTLLWLVRWVLYRNFKAQGETFRRRALPRGN